MMGLEDDPFLLGETVTFQGVTPENGWQPDDPALLPFGASAAYCRGLCLAVSFREGISCRI